VFRPSEPGGEGGIDSTLRGTSTLEDMACRSERLRFMEMGSDSGVGKWYTRVIPLDKRGPVDDFLERGFRGDQAGIVCQFMTT